MKNLEFNTQICTTIEQSKRLLELGLDDDTADMFHPAQHIGKDIVRYSDSPMRVQEEHFEIFVDDLPAWSLHRLIAMLPDKIEVMPHSYFALNLDKNSIAYIDSLGWGKVVCERGLLYDNLIDCVEWLIKENYLNKEYLKEGIS